MVRPSLVPVLLSRRAAISGGAFDPANVSGMMQRFLDTDPTYHASTLGGLPILTPEESGTLAIPRGQTCLSFDGVNDFATGPMATLTNLTITAKIKLGDTARRAIVAVNGTRTLFEFNSSELRWFPNTDSTVVGANVGNIAGSWRSVAITQSGTAYAIYLDGVQVGAGTTVAVSPGTGVSVGAFNAGLNFLGQMNDVRIYSVAKTAGEVLAIANQHLTPTTLDDVGLISRWWLNEESGSIAYDSYGNNDLTLTNGPTGTTDSGVTYNPANWLGHTVSGNVVIPRNESNTSQDAAGNALGVTGPLKRPATTEVRAWTGDGSGAHIACGNLTFDNTTNWEVATWVKFTGTGSDNRIWEIGDNNGACLNAHRNGTAGSIGLQVGSSNYVRHTGSTSFADNAWHYVRAGVSSGVPFLIVDGVAYSTVINAMTNTSATRAWLVGKYGGGASNYFAGSVCGMSLLYGGVTRYPLFDQCGPGTSNTNRDFHILFSDGTSTAVSGGVVNGTVATMYANYCPYVQDWCINNGGGVAVNGAFIPGRIGTGLDALGNAKTLAAGKHGNPYSLLVRNPWSAPELVNIGMPSSNKIAPSVDVQAASVVDTQFNRILSTGSNRYLAYRQALAGADKTNTEGYTT